MEDLSIVIDEAVGGELLDTGFGEDDEPNVRGQTREDLIDELDRIRWRLQGAPERKA